MNTRNLILIGLFMMIPVFCFGWGTEINGIYYSFDTDNKTACVVNGSGKYGSTDIRIIKYTGEVVIPETVAYEGVTYTVTSIQGGHSSGGYTPYYVQAFEESDITSISIPKTVENIEDYTFRACKNLKTVKFNGNIKSIGKGAFMENGLVTFDIPDGISVINEQTFKGCTELESISIPQSIKQIGDGVFMDCDNLNSVYINNLSAWCEISFVSGIKGSWGTYELYYNNEKLTEVVIPKGVGQINRYSFCGCTSITSVVLPETLNKIGWLSFFNCTNLETVTFNSYVNNIEPDVFKDCIKLKDIYCNTNICPSIEYDIFDNSAYETSTLHIYDYAVESFKEHTIWSKFKNIDVNKVTDFKLTYYVDGEIYKTELHKYEDEITPESNPTKKGMTFSGWSDIPAIMPGKDVDVTGTFTWAKDKIGGVIYQVTDTINNNAAVIGNDNASGEVKIVSPVKFDYDYSITDIVDNVFKNNTDITSVVIPESVRKIGDEAFSGCKNLAKIELGKSVNKIETRAFAGIDKLEEVIVYSENVPDADRTSFENSYIEYAILRVPANTDGSYRATMPWSGFKDVVPLEEIAPVEKDVVTIKESGKTTFCCEYDLDFTDVEGIKAYTATGYDDIDKTIWLTRVMKVPAGTGIMIKGTPGEYKIPHATVRATYANYLKGNLRESIRIEETDGDYTNYYLSGGTFKSVSGYANIGKGKAYLQLPTSVFAGTRSIEVNYSDEEGTTGISSTKQIKSEKALYYNLQGQRVDKPRKGLYIKNGKKVVIK